MSIDLLRDAVAGRTGSAIRPLLWYCNEEPETVFRELAAIKAAGIREVILENRGGDWFCTEPWFQKIGATLEKAKELGMQVWLLDDSHVNTGSANDSIKRPENARFRAQNLRLEAIDVAGPAKGSFMFPSHTVNETLAAAAAGRLDPETGICTGELIDLSGNQEDGLLFFDLPAGIWRIYYVWNADPKQQGIFANYVTMLSKDSCRHLIDEVHEKIYARFAPYFGNTFAGFFSDEPAFGNCDGNYAPGFTNQKLGQLHRLVGWWPDMPESLAKRTGWSKATVLLRLPALWEDVNGVDAALRLAYMEEVTTRWQQNFSGQLGDWCRSHGVRYIGHNLEDEGAHLRTGWGCGHYFRSVAGQDMAGIDIVLGQMLPGINTFAHALSESSKRKSAPFYQYTLPKLAPSMAHLTPAMHNQAVCEVFGAYGWTAGLSVMRCILNFYMSNGVNQYIPHAFSMIAPKVFLKRQSRTLGADSFVPPGFCMDYLPPSFYAEGFNPQYPGFCKLMQYVQRVCHLLNAGTHRADLAVYYAAESDWMNSGSWTDPDLLNMTVTRAGYDLELIPQDVLRNAAVKDGGLAINQESYKVLVVPSGECFPVALLRTLSALHKAGLAILFAGDALPCRTEDPAVDAQAFTAGMECVPLAALPERLAALHLSARRLTVSGTGLRHYTLEYADGSSATLLYNEECEPLTLCMESTRKMTLWEPWDNTLEELSGGAPFTLAPQQLLILRESDQPFPEALPLHREPATAAELDLRYAISCRANTETGDFRILKTDAPATDLTREARLTRFCGTFRYESTFACDDPAMDYLTLTGVSDGAELWLNGESCGLEIGPVCRFRVTGKLRKGANALKIEIADSPAYADRPAAPDSPWWGRYLPVLPHGFCGKVRLEKAR